METEWERKRREREERRPGLGSFLAAGAVGGVLGAGAAAGRGRTFQPDFGGGRQPIASTFQGVRDRLRATSVRAGYSVLSGRAQTANYLPDEASMDYKNWQWSLKKLRRHTKLTKWPMKFGMTGLGGGKGLEALGGAAGKIPIVGPMATKAAGVVGAGAAATGVLALAAAAALASKAAAKMTSAQIRLTEELVKSRKVYGVGAAYGMGLAPTGLAGAEAALATTKGALGLGGVARQVEERRTRAAEASLASGAGQTGAGFGRGLGAGPKWGWEQVKKGWRGVGRGIGGAVNWLPGWAGGAGVSGESVRRGAEAYRESSFGEDINARRNRLLLERAFPMLQHEYARGTAQEGMYPGAGAVAIATPANPMHRELVAKIDAAIDAINRLGRLP